MTIRERTRRKWFLSIGFMQAVVLVFAISEAGGVVVGHFDASKLFY